MGVSPGCGKAAQVEGAVYESAQDAVEDFVPRANCVFDGSIVSILFLHAGLSAVEGYRLRVFERGRWRMEWQDIARRYLGSAASGECELRTARPDAEPPTLTLTIQPLRRLRHPLHAIHLVSHRLCPATRLEPLYRRTGIHRSLDRRGVGPGLVGCHEQAVFKEIGRARRVLAARGEAADGHSRRHPTTVSLCYYIPTCTKKPMVLGEIAGSARASSLRALGGRMGSFAGCTSMIAGQLGRLRPGT